MVSGLPPGRPGQPTPKTGRPTLQNRLADPPNPAGRPPKSGWVARKIRPATAGRPRPKSGRAAGQIRLATRPAEAQIRLAAKSARLGRSRRKGSVGL